MVALNVRRRTAKAVVSTLSDYSVKVITLKDYFKIDDLQSIVVT